MVTKQFATRDINNAGRDINITNVYQSERIESIIADVINNLSKLEDMPFPFQVKQSKLPLEVEQKIKFNNIGNSRKIIELYKPFSSYLNSVYSNMEKLRISPREKVLQKLQNAYIEELSKYADAKNETIDVVRANSDIIFLGIKERIKNIVYSSINNASCEEEIDIALNVILADAFVSCQIMESEDK